MSIKMDFEFCFEIPAAVLPRRELNQNCDTCFVKDSCEIRLKEPNTFHCKYWHKAQWKCHHCGAVYLIVEEELDSKCICEDCGK